jgi:hypothetical protein
MIKDWGEIEKARILVIGHDPRLQSSDTIAEYPFFANYFTGYPKPSKFNRNKYNLAKSTFHQVYDLTNYNYQAEDIYITNLCNEELPHAPKGKTVFIPEEIAIEGVNRIKSLLLDSKIDIIFPTSLQVNYWLQKLKFYESENPDFILNAEPKRIGKENNPPYYIPIKSKAFQLICGNIYTSYDQRHKVIPILHPKSYSSLFLKFKEVYGPKYENIRRTFPKKIN